MLWRPSAQLVYLFIYLFWLLWSCGCIAIDVWMMFKQRGDDTVHSQSVDQLGPAHVLRAQRHAGRGENDHSQRGARPDRVHLLRQDGNTHAGDSRVLLECLSLLQCFFSFKYNFSFIYSSGSIFLLVLTFLYVIVARLMTTLSQ